MIPATAAIKTLTESDVKWEDVSSRLIDEVKNLKSNHRHSANTAKSACQICGKTNHSTAKCFLNPLNPHNRLELKSPVAEKNRNGKNDDDGETKPDPDGQSDKQKKKRGNERSAMARVRFGRQHDQEVEKMILDSGTTSHITPNPDKVCETISTNIPISLADDSSMTATAKGTR